MDPVKIDIIGEIGWEVDPEAVSKQIRSVNPKSPIEVDLHSPGGSTFGGYLIHNSLLDHPGPVSVKILGLAASAGSWIPFAADEGGISMHNLGQLMVHRNKGGAFDNADGLDRQAKLLRSLDSQLATLVANRTGMTEREAVSMMAKETWMTSAEAKDAGFVDSITEGTDPVNCLDLSRKDLTEIVDFPEDVIRLFGTEAQRQHSLVALLRGVPDLKPSEVSSPPPGLLDLVAAGLSKAQGEQA